MVGSSLHPRPEWVRRVKKAYLPFGRPKTGTTSIQKSLQASRTVLRENGLLYPGHEVDHATMIAPYHRAGGAHFWFARRDIEAADALAAPGSAASTMGQGRSCKKTSLLRSYSLMPCPYQLKPEWIKLRLS